MTSSREAEDDRGCLRLVLAVPLLLLTLMAAYFCWTALTVRPSGTWDEDAYGGITLSCSLTVGAAAAVAGIRLLPSVRRVLPWWCVSPALLLGVIASLRWLNSG
ncbi:hypothetical protein [Streptomyces griseosporeus]|uniref:hypothetical protein n=1 Tax=Streptomyces griseosporeus TaxID=1910 RepID=UPI00167F06AC|nr:hypothetical protein [Streptomyces griseosporeus]GHF64354.1 hypothetical protein GCM10018783_37260 [Streptomyces griseosporeus]